MIPHPWLEARHSVGEAIFLVACMLFAWAIGYTDNQAAGWRGGFAAMKKIHDEYAKAMTASYDRSVAIFNEYVANVNRIVGQGEKPKKPDLPS